MGTGFQCKKAPQDPGSLGPGGVQSHEGTPKRRFGIHHHTNGGPNQGPAGQLLLAKGSDQFGLPQWHLCRHLGTNCPAMGICLF